MGIIILASKKDNFNRVGKNMAQHPSNCISFLCIYLHKYNSFNVETTKKGGFLNFYNLHGNFTYILLVLLTQLA